MSNSTTNVLANVSYCSLVADDSQKFARDGANGMGQTAKDGAVWPVAWDHSDGAHICRPCFEDNSVEIRAALAASMGDIVEEEIVEQYRRLGGPACDPELFRQACDDELDAGCYRTVQADDEYLAMLEELKELTAAALEANRNLAQARQAVATYRNDCGFGKIVVKLQNTRNWLLSGGGGKFPSPGGKGPSDVCWVCGGPHFAFQCPDKDAGKSKGFG